ncbi:hypothetical protein BTO32_14910 [Marinobacter lutaoensis]|uniref:Uncharacterized protein n=1 Tax=Marinobacter lutaoensis TaxID=135739 RepID=A0A1V2DQ35_9GAMM|nr:hypothetical protein [Marinobacter lutaoensis]ONF42501.1 hypothetical protein BTO32_14910 [Marinobacter lutaoensis]
MKRTTMNRDEHTHSAGSCRRLAVWCVVSALLAGTGSAIATMALVPSTSAPGEEVKAVYVKDNHLRFRDVDAAVSKAFGKELARLGVTEIEVSATKGHPDHYMMSVTLGDDRFEYGAVYPDHRAMSMTVAPSGEVRIRFTPEERLGDEASYLRLAHEVSRLGLHAAKRYAASRNRVFMVRDEV